MSAVPIRSFMTVESGNSRDSSMACDEELRRTVAIGETLTVADGGLAVNAPSERTAAARAKKIRAITLSTERRRVGSRESLL